MKKSLIVKLEGSVDHNGLKRPGVFTYKLGQHVAPNYAVNLTTDNSDECYLVRNGVKVTGSYFQASQTTNDIEIHGTHFVKTLPTIDSESIVNLEDLAYFVSLTSIQLTDSDNNSGVKGNIESLSKLTNITSIQFSFSDTYSGNVLGNLNSLLDGLFANGKTSGSVYVYLHRTSVTYNGATTGSSFSKHFDFNENGWSER